MKEKHTLALAIVLLGLVIYYSIFEYNAPPKKNNQERGPLVFLLAPGEIKKVQINTGWGKELVCEKKNGKRWYLLKGQKQENWEAKINDFIENLLMIVEIDKFSVNTSQLKNYGLKEPAFQVILTDMTDKTYQLLIGDPNPGGTSVYAKFADSPQVIIVGGVLNWELEKVSSLTTSL